MSLSDRSPMRACGKRYATELDARCSKRGQQPDAVFEECWVPGCGGWHIRSEKVAAGSAAKGGGNEPTVKTRALVWARDEGRCVACAKVIAEGDWWSMQHRLARGQGGGNGCDNLIVLCGSATSKGCHRRAEDRDREYNARGYWLESWEIPALTPVVVFSPGGCGVSAYPTCDGQWSDQPGEVAA